MKEKLGELRVYTAFAGPAAREAIRAAEEEASRTCEVCGEPGTLRHDRSCYQVLCDRHAYAPTSRAIVQAAKLVELPRFRHDPAVAAVLDSWELAVEEGYVVLSGEERGSDTEVVEEIVLAVDVAPVPRVYTVRGWVELGRPNASVDAAELLPRMQVVADTVRDRILGRR